MTSTTPQSGAQVEQSPLFPAAPAAASPRAAAPALTPPPRGEGGPNTRTGLADGAHHAELPGVGDSARPGPAGERGEALPVGPRVMGLDLSAESSGVCLPDGTTLAIKAPKVPRSRKRTLLDDLQRLDNAEARIAELLEAHRPTLAVIEDYAFGAGGSGAHRGAEISGTIRLACHRSGASIALVNLTHLKIYATGNGKAEKRHMALEAFKRTGLEFATDDECDAAWLRWLGLDLLWHPEFHLPEKNRAVLNQITPSNGAPRG